MGKQASFSLDACRQAHMTCRGSIVTSPFAAMLSDRFGRRWSMFIGAWVIIVGAVIACSSSTVAQLTIARFILGSGISIMTVAAPAYAIEIAPAHWRGRCTGELLYLSGQR